MFFPPSTPERRDEQGSARGREGDLFAVPCARRLFGVRLQCEPHGIWGGLTEAERRCALPDDL
jgi:hypothetical protein